MKKTNINWASPKAAQGTTGFSQLGKIKASSILRKEEVNHLKGGVDFIIIVDKDVM